MKHWCGVWLMVLMAFGAQAQMLDNRECQVFSEEPFFHTNFMAANKVKAMHGQLSTKARMDRIRKGHMEYHYVFNKDGVLQYQSSSMSRGNEKIDTVVIAYHYDEEGRETTRRKNDVHGFYSYDYRYNEEGDLSEETYYRDENLGPSKFEFELGKRFIISSETFTWDKSYPGEERQRIHNNYGKAYMERSFRYDDDGYRIEVQDRFLRNNRTSTIQYEYNEKGHVSKKIEKTSLGGDNVTETTFLYDEVGNLIEENFYRNGTHISNKQYLYDGRMLINATLEKDVATEIITILQFTYEFYDE